MGRFVRGIFQRSGAGEKDRKMEREYKLEVEALAR